MNLINGRLLAEKIKDDIAKEVLTLCVKANCRRPGLAIILVGARPDSTLYVDLKDKAAKSVGIDTNLYKFDGDVSEAELLDTVNFLNTDDTIDGILVQLPLPENLDTDKIINAIAPAKDVDGFTSASLAKITTLVIPESEASRESRRLAAPPMDWIPARASLPNGNSLGWDDNSHVVISPVFQSVLACLEEAKFDLQNKTAAIVAKPGIFTDSLDKLLEHLGAKIVLIEPNEVGASAVAKAMADKKTATADLLITAVGPSSASSFASTYAKATVDKKATEDKASTTEADLIITAVGQPDLISADDIKDGAVIIDIGISKNETDKTCGDVDETSVADKVSWLTPVPGGIGPLTIAFALKNTLAFYKARNSK